MIIKGEVSLTKLIDFIPTLVEYASFFRLEADKKRPNRVKLEVRPERPEYVSVILEEMRVARDPVCPVCHTPMEYDYRRHEWFCPKCDYNRR